MERRQQRNKRFAYKHLLTHCRVRGHKCAVEKNIFITNPMPYLEFIYTINNSGGIITDSGGITEEATVLGIPCMTLRDSTERPETVTIGTNEMVGTNPDNIVSFIQKMVLGDWKKGGIPELWDGQTSERIVRIVSQLS